MRVNPPAAGAVDGRRDWYDDSAMTSRTLVCGETCQQAGVGEGRGWLNSFVSVCCWRTPDDGYAFVFVVLGFFSCVSKLVIELSKRGGFVVRADPELPLEAFYDEPTCTLFIIHTCFDTTAFNVTGTMLLWRENRPTV